MKSTGKSLTDHLIQTYGLEKASSGWRISACKCLASPTLVLACCQRARASGRSGCAGWDGVEGEGAFQPGFLTASRVCCDGLGVGGKLIFMAPGLWYPQNYEVRRAAGLSIAVRDAGGSAGTVRLKAFCVLQRLWLRAGCFPSRWRPSPPSPVSVCPFPF